MLKGIKMIQNLPQLSSTLVLNTVNPTIAVEEINSHIDSNYCKYMSVDISAMNIIDACHVSTLCSTKHFIKYPDGKISWKVSSNLIRNLNKNLELGNSEYI